jgi:hypothetical protein
MLALLLQVYTAVVMAEWAVPQHQAKSMMVQLGHLQRPCCMPGAHSQQLTSARPVLMLAGICCGWDARRLCHARAEQPSVQGLWDMSFGLEAGLCAQG